MEKLMEKPVGVNEETKGPGWKIAQTRNSRRNQVYFFQRNNIFDAEETARFEYFIPRPRNFLEGKDVSSSDNSRFPSLIYIATFLDSSRFLFLWYYD